MDRTSLCSISGLVDKFCLYLQHFDNIIVDDSRNTDKATLKGKRRQLIQKLYYSPLFYRHT